MSQVGQNDNTPVQLAVQPDGKIVALSTIQHSSLYLDGKILVTRYNPDGTLDPTFGADGRVVFDAAPNGEHAGGLALQDDGRIVVSGVLLRSLTPYDIGPSLIMFRLLPDGSLDPSFGGAAAGGATAAPDGSHMTSGCTRTCRTWRSSPDGDILGGGGADQQPMLVRFNANGSRDAGFGTNGKLVPALPGINGLNDMAVQQDGKILLLPAGGDFLVARLNPDGSFDATFDGDGRATVGFGYGTPVAISLELLPDGAVLIAGSTPCPPDAPQTGGDDAVVAKLTATGALDATFADGGKLRTAAVGPYNSGAARGHGAPGRARARRRPHPPRWVARALPEPLDVRRRPLPRRRHAGRQLRLRRAVHGRSWRDDEFRRVPPRHGAAARRVAAAVRQRRHRS